MKKTLAVVLLLATGATAVWAQSPANDPSSMSSGNQNQGNTKGSKSGQ
jgi:hypothetical protein